MILETSSEQTYDQFENEKNMINQEFPNTQFTISIPYNELDNVVSMDSTIYILDSRYCYCNEHNPLDTRIFKITSNRPITNRIVLKELIRQRLSIDCNHHFVEGFHKLNNNPRMFEILTGS